MRGCNKNGNALVLHARVVCQAGGGPEKTILNSPRFLKSAGFRTLCAYMFSPHDPGFVAIREKAQRWEAPLLGVEDRGAWDWKVFFHFLGICRQERVAIWHGHDYKSNLLGLLLRPFWPMHLVTTVHGWGVLNSRRIALYNAVDRLCLPWYDRVLCVSPDLHQACRAAGVLPERCLLIDNAIDTEEFSRQRSVAEAKKILGIPEGRAVLGAVGRLSAEKAFDLLLRAVHRLWQQGLDVHLLIVGEGEERNRLQALIDQLGLKDRVQLLGYRADVRIIYESMDVYVLSSLREGLPNVLLEAMALEVPVLATRVGGVPRLVSDGVNGLLVEAGSVEDLERGLTRLLGDAGLRQQLARAGRQTIEKNYSFKTRMEKIGAIYDNLLGRDMTQASGMALLC